MVARFEIRPRILIVSVTEILHEVAKRFSTILKKAEGIPRFANYFLMLLRIILHNTQAFIPNKHYQSRAYRKVCGADNSGVS